MTPQEIYEGWRIGAKQAHDQGLKVSNFLGYNVNPPTWEDLPSDKKEWFINHAIAKPDQTYIGTVSI